MENKTAGENTIKPERTERICFKVLAGLAATAIFFTFFFIVSGRFDWVRGWSYVGLIVVGQGSSAVYIWQKNPELLRRRSTMGEGTKGWDKILLSLFQLAYFGSLMVGAYDERFGWSVMSGWFWLAGAIPYLFFVIILTWAMSVNTHFEKTVRIQTDRGHKVIDTGPYKIIRHPGYAGAIFGFLLPVPFLLGSWCAFIPACFGVLILVIRTILEDRLLRRELDGYKEYARKVQYRLIPGLW
jgi:protein-S-isoprenylcysteine O-methyltransferase Ste14